MVIQTNALTEQGGDMGYGQIQWRKASTNFCDDTCVEIGVWNKASGSFANSNCVEAGVWNKASKSFANSNCVETTLDDNVVLVRDTKRSRIEGDKAPVQSYTLRQWQRIIDAIKSGKLVYGSTASLKLGLGVKLTLEQQGDTTLWRISGQDVVHEYTRDEMEAFVAGVKADEFDLAPELALQLAAA
jgi:Domain of unknown function (DUF397)